MYNHNQLLERFASGFVSGRSSSMFIEGDKLYSYNKCIAIREIDKFILSNCAKFLGGASFSTTTSCHLSRAYYYLSQYKPVMLVSGWAEKGKEEFKMKEQPTHKTVWGFFRSLRTTSIFSAWIGDVFADGTKLIELQLVCGKILDGNDNVIATRESVKNYSTNLNYHCTRNCESCPAKFMCYTAPGSYSGYVFFIKRGTKYETMAKKHLRPSLVVDNIKERVIGRLY